MRGELLLILLRAPSITESRSAAGVIGELKGKMDGKSKWSVRNNFFERFLCHTKEHHLGVAREVLTEHKNRGHRQNKPHLLYMAERNSNTPFSRYAPSHRVARRTMS